jgi:FHS family L-fucose permease-like MFS transporter
MEKKQNSNVLAIVVMILLFGMVSFVTNLASPMGDVLKNQFQVANWMGTLGVFANFIAYAVMGIPAGNMLQKFGYKKTALIAIGVGFTGVAFQTASGYLGSFAVYLLGAFIAGLSMCMLNIVINPMLNKLAGGGNKGNQLLQIGASFNSLMATTVIILTGLLIPNIVKAHISQVFPLMYTALGIFALAFVVVLFTYIPENAPVEAVKDEKSQYGPMSFRHFVLGAIGVFVYLGIEVGIPNVLQKWLNVALTVENATAIAGSVAGTYWFLMLAGRLVGVAVSSKVSAKNMLAVVSAAGIVVTLFAIFLDPATMVNMPVFDGVKGFAIASVPINAALLGLSGLCTSVMWGGVFNLAVEGLGKYTEKASGIFMALVCGGGILPLLQNGIIDWTGNYLVSYWVIVVCMVYMLFYALVGSKNVNKDIPVE